MLADKGCDADAIAGHVEAMGAIAVIPPKRNRKVHCEHDKGLYKQRNRIERRFSRLKCFRRFATRYERSKVSFKAIVAPRLSMDLPATIGRYGLGLESGKIKKIREKAGVRLLEWRMTVKTEVEGSSIPTYG